MRTAIVKLSGSMPWEPTLTGSKLHPQTLSHRERGVGRRFLKIASLGLSRTQVIPNPNRITPIPSPANRRGEVSSPADTGGKQVGFGIRSPGVTVMGFSDDSLRNALSS
jgi:hypothetical protein